MQEKNNISKKTHNLKDKYQYSEDQLLGKGATGFVYKGNLSI